MKWYSVLWRGAAMGAADLIPGISGGTIAFITHIYERLIQAVMNFLHLPKQLFVQRIGLRAALKEADAAFLSALLGGIFLSIAALSRVVPWLLEVYPRSMYALFIGLIIAASIAIYRETSKGLRGALWLALGVLAGVAIAFIPFTQAAPTNLTFFAVGAVAISAMLLPGISGSYLLLIFGQYQALLVAVQQPLANAATLISFLAGAFVGAALFSHVIAWTLRKGRKATLAVLTGLMLGALIVPYKELSIAASNEPVFVVVLLGVAGVVAVSALEVVRVRTLRASAD